MASSMLLRQRYRRFDMFVNQVLFRYKTLLVSLTFGMLECCSSHFNRKIATSFMKRSNSLPLKLSESWIFSEMLTSGQFCVKFQCFDEKITKRMIFTPTS